MNLDNPYNNRIHPTAIIDGDVRLGRGVKIGAYCVITGSVVIGDNTEVKPYTEIRDGVTIGSDCYIDSRVTMTGSAKIGNSVTIRNGCIIARGVEIGDNSFIAPQVMFNNLDTDKNKIGGAKIGANCFVGTNTTFQHGVTVCDGVTIGAKSFVFKDIRIPGVYLCKYRLDGKNRRI